MPRTALRGTLFLALLLLAFPAPGAQAQLPIEAEITASERRLEQIRSERSETRAELTRIRSRVTDLTSELSNLILQSANTAALLHELEFQISHREAQIALNRDDLEQTREQLADRRAALAMRLRQIYMRGPLHTLEVLLSAESFPQLLNRYRYLFLIARQDRRLAEEIARLEERLVAREGVLRADLEGLQQVRTEQEREHEHLEELEELQRIALANVRAEEETTAARIAQLEADERRIGELIARLERSRIAATRTPPAPEHTAAAPLSTTLEERNRGSIGWPVDGPLLYEFGRMVQPNGTTVRWNGIGIGARTGTPVRAVAAGTVALAGPFEGYGPTVILSHGQGYYTLYLYLRELEVEEGEEIVAGQTLGKVGGERSTEGPHMEFQIRVPGGEAVDPLTWLQRR